MNKRYSSWLSFAISLAALLIVLLAVVNPAGAIRNRAPDAGSPTVVSYQGYVSVSGTGFTGLGYFKFAVVNSAGSNSFWSNDGTSSAGSEPTNPVQLPVYQGQFNVLLGDTSITHMSQAMTAGVFSATNRYLRVWFSTDNITFSLLSPDVRFASAPFALQAENANTAGDADTLDGQHAAAILPSGAYILGQYLDANLLAAGFRQTGASQEIDYRPINTWSGPSSAPLAPRYAHTTIWTGNKMIVYGGRNSGGSFADGAIYDPANDTWTSLTPGPLVPRAYHTAVWTGSEMIIWGGVNSSGALFDDGARYNPTTDAWEMLAAVPLSLAARAVHTAVWTGSEMIIWGGSSYNDGARYNPATDSWTYIPPNGLDTRSGHVGLWTGSAMIVWGGAGAGGYYADGAIYNPASGAWLDISGSPIGGRQFLAAVWTGAEMIVWGGHGGASIYYADGARYNPTSDTWVALPACPLAGRYGLTAEWTLDGEMVIWGGYGGGSYSDGARFNLSDNTWTMLAGSGLAARYWPKSVWTGTEVIVWGGLDGSGGYFNDGVRYLKLSAINLYLFRKP